MGVYIQGGYATQGPAPDGFHVPLMSEWKAAKDVWTALGGGSSDGTNFGIALRLPSAGCRHYSSGNVTFHGNGYYWSSSRSSTNSAYSMKLKSDALIYDDSEYRAMGYSIRCFKNSPTIPTSSWTKLYGTSIEAGGIFWSGSEGLISLSSDGSNWITISDKNLGATQVWNNGDTLSETNCGKFYQWGNNYDFPFTGSVTTSSTQVNASTYGPGNYYSSSTFITIYGSWDSSNNLNLRGGVDGNVPTMSELKNAYIGEYVEPMPAGIYWSSSLGLITIADGAGNDITIADKNLGAYSVWNSGVGLSQDNCGIYYQWGNNQGFRWSGTISPTSTSPVNASTYGPGNYYSSSTFIKTSPRDSSYNANLRGGVTGTNEAMRGPCSSGYHIPSNTEWLNIYNIWESLGGGSSDGTNFGLYLKLPFAGNRQINTNTYSQGSQGYYWASTYRSSEVGYCLFFGGSYIYPQSTSNASNACSIRPFKNEAVQPDSSRTKLY